MLITLCLPLVTKLKTKKSSQKGSIEKNENTKYVQRRGYYMAVRKYEIFLRVLKNISRVREPLFILHNY